MALKKCNVPSISSGRSSRSCEESQRTVRLYTSCTVTCTSLSNTVKRTASRCSSVPKLSRVLSTRRGRAGEHMQTFGARRATTQLVLGSEDNGGDQITRRRSLLLQSREFKVIRPLRSTTNIYSFYINCVFLHSCHRCRRRTKRTRSPRFNHPANC